MMFVPRADFLFVTYVGFEGNNQVLLVRYHQTSAITLTNVYYTDTNKYGFVGFGVYTFGG
jgi:hypothetical protein